MKSLSKMILAFVIIIMVSACATTDPIIPEKYMLDEQLERVKEIQDYLLGDRMQPAHTTITESFESPQSIMSRRDTVVLSEAEYHWIKVDQQSLILRNGPSEYYLVVLQRPTPNLMFIDSISLNSPSNIIRAGLDLVQLGQGMYYKIDRIYRINSHEQMYAVKDQLAVKN